MSSVPNLDRWALSLLEDEARPHCQPHPDGYDELLPESEEPDSTGRLQDMCLSATLPKIYERWWRPAFSRLLLKGPLGPSMKGERRIAGELLDLRPGARVLDVACGTGNFTRHFAAAVGPQGRVVGTDVSRSMLAQAVADTRAAGLDIPFFHANAETMPFRDDSFDAVGCWASFQLFQDPLRGLDRMIAVLAPGGRLGLFTSLTRGRGVVRAMAIRTAERSGAHTFDPGELEDAMRRRGLVDIKQSPAGIMQFIGGRLPG